MLQTDDLSSRWDNGRIIEKYRIIIRDIIMIFVKWESREIYDGNCGVGDIEIVEDRARITTSPSSTVDRIHMDYYDQLSNLVCTIVGLNESIPEINIKSIWYHPLLQSSEERFYFPVDTVINLNYHFDRCADGSYDWEHYVGELDKELELDKMVSGMGDFDLVFKRGKYRKGMSAALKYVRNVVIHVNELKRQGQTFWTQDAVERQLATLFPTLFAKIFCFMANWDINMDFNFRRVFGRMSNNPFNDTPYNVPPNHVLVPQYPPYYGPPYLVPRYLPYYVRPDLVPNYPYYVVPIAPPPNLNAPHPSLNSPPPNLNAPPPNNLNAPLPNHNIPRQLPHYISSYPLEQAPMLQTRMWGENYLAYGYQKFLRDLIDCIAQLEEKDIKYGYLNNDTISIIDGCFFANCQIEVGGIVLTPDAYSK
ncbi:hypothetical protein ACE6H2_023415 [Prunus campanulata]